MIAANVQYNMQKKNASQSHINKYIIKLVFRETYVCDPC